MPFKRLGKARKKVKQRLSDRVHNLENAAGIVFRVLDGAVQKYGPVEIIDKLMTPERLEAISRGIGYGIAQGLKDQQK